MADERDTGSTGDDALTRAAEVVGGALGTAVDRRAAGHDDGRQARIAGREHRRLDGRIGGQRGGRRGGHAPPSPAGWSSAKPVARSSASSVRSR